MRAGPGPGLGKEVKAGPYIAVEAGPDIAGAGDGDLS